MHMNGFEQQTLFSSAADTRAPLAERMRPRTLEEFIGQKHILGEGRLLRRAIQADRLGSCIFWGPPGCGKTTLAGIIANMTGSAFEKLNAVTSGVADVRKVIKDAEERRRFGRATYLLLDECHRWSKSQSDSILPAVESGLIRLIGSTTENPMVSMTPAIVSRCRVFEFQPLTTEDVLDAMNAALRDPDRGFGREDIRFEDGALRYIAQVAGGDVRTALGALELAVLTTEEQYEGNNPFKYITLFAAQESVQKPMLKLDENLYYDMLSAFCKSLRGSDPDAALLWFSRLMYAGVDPKLVVRRIIVHASEDVGLADPTAMLMAHAAANALEFVGLPEAKIPIAQAIIAVAMAEKSNSVSAALEAAEADARNGNFTAVPVYLRDQSYSTPHTQTPGYRFPHDYPDHFVDQVYMPKGYEKRVYYHPSEQGHEAKLKARHFRRYGAKKT